MVQKEDRRLNSIIGGKWRVDKVLGTGSMATVYAVTHRNGVHAALKILHPTLCTDPKVCERFLGEGYLTNAVKHPGIVRVLDDGMTDDGCVFLVMDLLEGKTLEVLRQESGGKIDLDVVLDIADSLMDTLHAVHSAGIIHRDLKPQNVFICSDGSVKLLDFGVARVLESSSSRSKMSLFGMVLVTPSFMSPEQAIGARDQVDHRADVYSLGATIFTALTGETVHLGPHVQAKLLAAGTVQARSISVVKQDLPPAIANVIDTALRFDKSDRWQSVDAFRRALREARQASGSTSHITITPLVSERKPLHIIDKGPTRTIIGVGGSDPGPGPGPQFPKPPTRTRTQTLPFGVPVDPHAGHSGAAKTLPMGIMKTPHVIEEETTLDEEESIPAVHTPVPSHEEIDPLLSQLQSKRNNGAFVAASLGLIAAAIAGVAFFAMGGNASTPNASADEGAVTAAAPATLTSATAPPSQPAPAPSGPQGDAGPARQSSPGSSVHPSAHAAITPPPAWHPRSRTQPQNFTPVPQSPNPNPNPNPNTQPSFPRLPVTPEPPPAQNAPAPAASPSVSPDPFSTPE
jgi:serine/threonine-protein kinase